MIDSSSQSNSNGVPVPRLMRGVVWLRQHRSRVLGLGLLTIATAFILDLLIPGYAIAGSNLVPLLLATFALRERLLVAVVAILCLALTILALVIQGRTNAQNVLLVGFGALAGLGLIALGHLYNRFDALYQSERATTAQAAVPHRAAAAAAGGVGARLRPAALRAARLHRPASAAAARG